MTPSRFAELRRGPAWLILAALAALIALGMRGGDGRFPVERAGAPAASQASDAALYHRIITRLHHGEGYYAVATEELRTHDYPLRPAFTVRLPTHAVALAALPNIAAGIWTLRLLVGVALLAVIGRTRRALPLWPRAILLLTAVMGAVPLLVEKAMFFHESWATALILLSLGLHGRRSWPLSLMAGVAAALTRELALPYLVVMAGVAWFEGDRRQAVAWLAAIGVFLAAVVVHAHVVEAYLRPTDPASPGWAGQGWSFVLMTARWQILLYAAPMWLIAALVPLSLLGLAGWKDPMGARLALTVAAYMSAFCLVGRLDNFYWGLLYAPLLLSGLAVAPSALRDLLRAATRAPATA